MLKKKDNRDDQAEELRLRAEKIFKERQSRLPEKPESIAPEEAGETIYKLQVHQIELELQNEELRRIQIELDLSRSRYFDLYDLAPVGYCTLSEKGLILEANFTAANMLGVSRNMMVGRLFTVYIHKNDQDIYYLLRKQLFETGEPQSCELRMHRPDGTILWTNLSAVIAEDIPADSAADTESVSVCRVVISDISRQKLSEEQIKTLLAEKQLLLKEVHHRIKNNMNTISGFLMLQAGSMSDAAAAAALIDAQSRVRNMMILYDRLYQSENYGSMPIKEYLENFIDDIIVIFEASRRIKIVKDISDFVLDAKILFPLGIIINELITNAFKYAFPDGREGAIKVSVKKTEDRISISINDNGAGYADKVGSSKSGGFGLNLVTALAEQFGGEVKIIKDNGTNVEVSFSEDV